MCKRFDHPGVLDFQDTGGRSKDLTRGGEFRGFETRVGAMLWDSFMVIYYIHIPDSIIKLLVSVIQ